MVLTEVKKRRKLLTELFLDGESAGRIATEIWLRSGYRVGDDLSEEALEALFQESERYRASEKALYLLEYRAHSKKELEEKISRVTSREAAKEAVSRMEDLGLMDDEQYARARAADLLTRKGYAAKRAVYELQQKGIDRELAAEIVEELEPDPCEKIRALLEKKYPQAGSDEACRRRAVAALQRLGYRYGDIRTVLSELDEETADV
ncbi:regulatory protein RecX [Yeguia hominis]|uniref:Regulatory protein RecX n=1 Tax=Yeguia hominis TaxID=2763662 RepID=A0A926D7C4_9FIRM|nr:regulatory protein RecX [Yeguia hominis]MBC8533770.1 regulatory protein RecX [Yeguia hominis]